MLTLAGATAGQSRPAPKTPPAGLRAIKNDWKFPAPGLKSEYSDELKATIYDMGDGFHAARVKIKEREFVFVSIPPGTARIEDSDLALLVADKVLRLPKALADTILPQEEKHEHLFRTANGLTVGVTLAHDRRSAVVRLIEYAEL